MFWKVAFNYNIDQRYDTCKTLSQMLVIQNYCFILELFNDTASTSEVMRIRMDVAMVVCGEYADIWGEATVDYVKASSIHSRRGTEENLLQ
jgi:hypothetical protein